MLCVLRRTNASECECECKCKYDFKQECDCEGSSTSKASACAQYKLAAHVGRLSTQRELSRHRHPTNFGNIADSGLTHLLGACGKVPHAGLF